MAKKYKMKTHRGAKKRFRVTRRGKFLRMKGHRSHLRRKKSAATKRQFKGMMALSPSDEKRVRRTMPYDH